MFMLNLFIAFMATVGIIALAFVLMMPNKAVNKIFRIFVETCEDNGVTRKQRIFGGICLISWILLLATLLTINNF